MHHALSVPPLSTRAQGKAHAIKIYVAILCALTVGLAILSAPRQLASPLLADIASTPQRAKVPGYDRAKFGRGWTTPSGVACTTRDIVITNQGANAAPLCPPLTTTNPPTINNQEARDPYSGEVISTDENLGLPIEIDHIIPLSAAWDLGAHSWDQETRIKFANDPLNLVAVSKAQNQSKSDQLPSQWLPPQRSARCWYVNRMTAVAHHYGLPLPKDDITAMKRQCLPNPFSTQQKQ